jgi:DNA-binding response OmpR family regulator
MTSKINQGSKFVVRIPLERDSFSDDERSPVSEIPAKTTNPKSKTEEKVYQKTRRQKDQTLPNVLIVEDNRDLNTFITTSLSEDFTVLTAFNGKEGLEAAISNIPDLIVTDIMMPEMDGNEMTKLLKKDDRTRHIPVIMLTAKADRSSTLEGLECGADDYISKPFNMDELLMKIRNIIETGKRIRQKFREEFLTTPNASEIPSPRDKLVRNVIELMKKKMDEPGFRVGDLCRELYISRTQLYRKIEALTGYNPGELLRLIRLKTAAAMFRKGHENVAQVMYEVGFNNQSHFARIFKEQFGLSPSAYLHRFRDR